MFKKLIIIIMNSNKFYLTTIIIILSVGLFMNYKTDIKITPIVLISVGIFGILIYIIANFKNRNNENTKRKIRRNKNA